MSVLPPAPCAWQEEKKKYKEQKRIMKMDSRDIQGKLKEGPLKVCGVQQLL